MKALQSNATGRPDPAAGSLADLSARWARWWRGTPRTPPGPVAPQTPLLASALQDAIFNSANFSCIACDARGVIQIFNVGAQ